MAREAAASIRPRAMNIDFDEVPRHWLGGRALPTHIANGANLLFPAGERFFIRSVLRYLDRIEDAELRTQISGFCGQESHHAHAHERQFEILRAQGFDVDRFLRRFERIAFGFIEPKAPPSLRLAVTAALEHFTAIMGENALREGHLQPAHPAMRQLLLWHAAEEIEHKSVAYDVLQQVAPSYALRMAGLAIAAVGLAGFWAAATASLLRQDAEVDRKRLREEWRELRQRHSIFKRVFLRGVREYVRRDFHPWQNDNLALAREHLAASGMA
jgi:uncharacterized protein